MLDVFVLLLASGVTAGLYNLTLGYSVLILFVVGHFFLFCNVFRVRRGPELVWTGLFVANAGTWFLLLGGGVLWLCGSQLVATALILLNELRVPCYHGIFARQINPRLDDYLVGRL